jgi:hypothetical protein
MKQTKGSEKGYFSSIGFDKHFPFLNEWPNDVIKDLKALLKTISQQCELALIHPIMLA